MKSNIDNYCAQVCGGGQRGTGPACPRGIDVHTQLPADTVATPLTGEQDGVIARAIELGKRQIQQEIAAGRIPPTVTDFAKLHDFVDANEFGGLCEVDGEWSRLFPRTNDQEAEVFCEAANRVQDALDQWLGNGTERNALLIGNLVENALNAACLAIQDGLKLNYGDVAGVFFSGAQKEAFREMFTRYVLCEIAMMSDPEDG